MKKIVCAVLIFTMVMFLTPLSSDARGGHGGGGYWGWWLPWAIIGGAAILAPLYTQPPPPVVVVREQPPANVQPAPSAPLQEGKSFVYPRHGQNEELQVKDRYECHIWAVSQTHFDPTQPTGSMPDPQMNQMRSDYQRAISACLDARGYTMK